MPGRILIPTDAEIAAAFANPPPKHGPRATSVSYRPARDEVRLVLTGAVTLLVPRTAIHELREPPEIPFAPPSAHARRGCGGPGSDDVHISVPGLVRDLVGFEKTETAPAHGSTRTTVGRSSNRRKAPAA